MLESLSEKIWKPPLPVKILALALFLAAGFYLDAPGIYFKNLFAALVIFAACLLAVLSMGMVAYFYKKGHMDRLVRIFILAIPVLIGAGMLFGAAYSLLIIKQPIEEWAAQMPGVLVIAAVALAAAFAIAKSFENADAGTAFVGIGNAKPKGIK